MASDVRTEGGITIVNPNKLGTNVKYEDLMVYVRLLARTKSRSILEKKDEDIVQLEQTLKNVPDQTNYTYPAGAKMLTTDWTDIGGATLNGKDVGGFGITDINIDVKSSFIPQVTISFVDIRGATLFEQGPCSPYASFFHMPYPVFELTVKGFYGKPVTYSLALRKFTTKFNPSTGNFEVKAEFIGYTYAFLADLVMGYGLAAPYMPGAKEKFRDIWAKYLTYCNVTPKTGDPNFLPQEAVTLKKMIKDINDLELTLSKLANSDEFQVVNDINIIKSNVQDLTITLREFRQEILENPKISGKSEEISNYQNDTTKIKILKTGAISGGTESITEAKKIYVKYFGDSSKKGIYGDLIDGINAGRKEKLKNTQTNLKDLPTVEQTFNKCVNKCQAGFKDDTSVNDGNNEEYYFIDTGNVFIKSNDEYIKKIDEELETLNEGLTDLINQAVEEELGYVPTVRNVFAIILANMELFLNLLTEASEKAENEHDRNDNIPLVSLKNKGIEGVNSNKINTDDDGNVTIEEKSKVFPWPQYYTNDSDGKKTGSKGSSVEKYPGETPELKRWEEVKFVENFIKGYLDVLEELEIVLGDVEGKNGFDNFIPLNPMESRLMEKIDGIIPNSYWRDSDLNNIYKNVGERAFLAGDYTSMNRLTGWRSRFTDNNKTGDATQTPSTLSSRYNSLFESTKGQKFTTTEIMKQWGKIDGINAANTFEAGIDGSTSTILNKVLYDIEDLTVDEFYERIKEQLEAKTSFKSRSFSDWVSETNTTGLSEQQIKNLINDLRGSTIVKDGTNVLTLDSITIGEQNSENVTTVYPNTWKDNNFVILNAEDSIPSMNLTSSVIKTEFNSSGNVFKDGYVKDLSTWGELVLKNMHWTDKADSDDTAFSPNPDTLVPYIGDVWDSIGVNGSYFIKRYPWDSTVGNAGGSYGTFQLGNLGINYDGYTDDGFGAFYANKKYRHPDDVGYGAPLIHNPLWQYNQYTSLNGNGKSKVQKLDQEKGDSVPYIPSGNDTPGQHETQKESAKALAYLALITMCYAPGRNDEPSDGVGYAGWYDSPSSSLNNDVYEANYDAFSVTPFFNVTGAQVRVPKGWTYLTGAVLWRLREDGRLEDLPSQGATGRAVGTDPIYWPSSLSNGTADTSEIEYKKFESYHWPHCYQRGEKEDYTHTFSLIPKDSDDTDGTSSKFVYVDIREEMKSLLMLPVQAKKEFIQKFEDFASRFQEDYLPGFDPLNWGSTSVLRDYYGYTNEDDDYFVILNGVETERSGGNNAYGGPNNKEVNNMYTELFEQFHYISFATPRSWMGIHKDDYPSSFNISEDEIKAFLEGWRDGYKNAVQERKQNISEGSEADNLAGDRALDDPDIKLNLYKSFKSLFDKWISRASADSGKYKMFYNNVPNNSNKERLLIEHFNFVNRAFNDIGNKAVIDVTFLKDIGKDPTKSLYQLTTEILSKNNFDFFPLPSFINYASSEGKKAVETMFEPVTELTQIDASPSFVCMYIGGTSKNVDIGPTGQSFCDNSNKISTNYEDDGFKIVKVESESMEIKKETVPEDLTDGNVTAFLVEYGIENQSHFTSVSLDQAEFKETQESLMVIDQLAKGGNENNRVAKGQNLYNIYQTRSYTCEVECLGNMMIQPMMYFQLHNVPMFWGAYLITEVKHKIKPHHVTTTFKGTRVPRVVVPLVTDPYSTMVLSQTDPKKSSGPASEILKNAGSSKSQGSEQNEVSVGSGTSPGTAIPIKTDPPKDAPKLTEVINVMKNKKGVFYSRNAASNYSSKYKNKLFSEVKSELISENLYRPNENYTIYEEPYVVNIVGIRSFAQRANSFDDFLTVFYVDPTNGTYNYNGKKWTYAAWPITTEPGATTMSTPDNNLGAGIFAEGQFIHSHHTGLHRSKYSALWNSSSPILVYRDNDRDKWAEKSTDNLRVFIPGMNIHASGPYTKGETADVKTWSAGCQVFRDPDDYMEFLYHTLIVAQNDVRTGKTHKISINNNGGCGSCSKKLSDFVPSEIQSQLKDGVTVNERWFTYTLLNSSDFGNPSNIIAGNGVYEQYINSGIHSA